MLRKMILTVLTICFSPIVIAHATDKADAPFAHQEITTVKFTSGGIGRDERVAMEELERQYTLKVENTYAGKYITDVMMVIKNNAGKTIVNTPIKGPLFYAELDPGHYMVEATYQGETKSQAVTINEDRIMVKSVAFAWQ
jgi:hypothetical protein